MKRKINSILICAFSTVLLTSANCKRNNTCSGVVVDAATLLPIDSVKVTPAKVTTRTDAAGRYEVNFETQGKLPIVTFYKSGYQSKDTECFIGDSIKLEQ